MPINIDEINKKRQQLKIHNDERQRSFNSSDGELWRPPQGKTQFRILPPIDDNQMPCKEVGYHYTDSRNFLCPRITKGLRCPWCELVDSYKRSPVTEEQIFAKKLDVNIKGAWWIIIRGESPMKPKIWISSPKIYEKLLDLIAEKTYGDFTDLETGRDFFLTTDKPAVGPIKYDLMPDGLPKPAITNPEELTKILEMTIPLDEVFKCMSYEKLAALIEIPEVGNIMNPSTNPAPTSVSTADPASPVVSRESGTNKPIGAGKCFGKEYDPQDPECSMSKCQFVGNCSKIVGMPSPVAGVVGTETRTPAQILQDIKNRRAQAK